MSFAAIEGNTHVCKALAGMVDSGRIPHAILLHEDDGGGAVQIAQAFLQYLFCRNHVSGDSCSECPSCNKISKLIHPDVHYVFPVSGAPCSSFAREWRELVTTRPFFTEALLYETLALEGKSTLINVAEAKEVLGMLSLSALEGGNKAVVIYLPEKMNREAANRLLKSIEEPPAKTQFILITHSPESVLQTIVSRCQLVRIAPVRGRTPDGASIDESYDEVFGELMSALLSKNLMEALEVGEKLAALPSRESAKNFCRYASERFREIFLCQQGLSSLIDSNDSRIVGWASGSKKTMPRGAVSALGRARYLIERNVSAKIVFTDLVDRLIMNI